MRFINISNQIKKVLVVNKRWCIVSGPRTGSTWFESCIYAALLDSDPTAEKLQEFIHPHVAFENTIELLPNKSLKFIEGKNNGLKSKKELFEHIKTVIAAGDLTQSLTCRIFCQLNHYTLLDYYDFLSLLLDRDFKLINLNRNLFDRALSLYFALETGIWHKTLKDNKVQLIRHSDMPPDKKIEKIQVDVAKFQSIYFYQKMDVNVRENIFKTLPCLNVYYENIYKDVARLSIPFNHSSSYIKVHDEKYQEYILNLDEVVESVKNL